MRAVTATPANGHSWVKRGARGADLLIVTDDNPRTEDPAKIRASVMQAPWTCPNPNAARFAKWGTGPPRSSKQSGGHSQEMSSWWQAKATEVGQEIDGVKHPFDDREVLAK